MHLAVLSLGDFIAYSFNAPIKAMFYVFVPESQNPPSGLFEGLINTAVPCNVGIDLIEPERPVCAKAFLEACYVSAVPEGTVAKHCNLWSYESYVRTPKCFPVVLPVP